MCNDSADLGLEQDLSLIDIWSRDADVQRKRISTDLGIELRAVIGRHVMNRDADVQRKNMKGD